VGNHLGKGNAQDAAQAGKTGFQLGLAVAVVSGLSIFLCRDYLALPFSHDQAIIDKVSSVGPIFAGYQIFDSLNAQRNGLFRGAGHQKTGMYLNLFVYYLIGLPLTALLAFPAGMGLQGCWLGMTSALCLTTLVGGYLVWRIDWEQEVVLAQQRLALTSPLAINSDEQQPSQTDEQTTEKSEAI
jgi:multidrug resistance protein, MATE family